MTNTIFYASSIIRGVWFFPYQKLPHTGSSCGNITREILQNKLQEYTVLGLLLPEVRHPYAAHVMVGCTFG